MLSSFIQSHLNYNKDTHPHPRDLYKQMTDLYFEEHHKTPDDETFDIQHFSTFFVGRKIIFTFPSTVGFEYKNFKNKLLNRMHLLENPPPLRCTIERVFISDDHILDAPFILSLRMSNDRVALYRINKYELFQASTLCGLWETESMIFLYLHESECETYHWNFANSSDKCSAVLQPATV